MVGLRRGIYELGPEMKTILYDINTWGYVIKLESSNEPRDDPCT